MALTEQQLNTLEDFFHKSDFSTSGAVITDLDGTAVHEYNGMVIIHREVELGLKKIYDLGRPVVINTLRFPLSVIRTFAKEWYKISGKPIPVVLLNGSQLGYITQSAGDFVFEQVKAHTLHKVEVEEIITTISELQHGGIEDLILFYYPEDWTAGEIIWTPHPGKVEAIQSKYKSATSVTSTGLEELRKTLLSRPICMILLLVEARDDQLMAYQHSKRSNFITHDKVDKLSGTIDMSKHLGFSMQDSLGAGDSNMDVFLAGTGLAIHVRNSSLPFEGKKHTLRLTDYHDYGQLLALLSTMQKQQLISR
jgi:hydroxymethylpyrimidine pyrophosphatase-like HAD family hydrolase